MSQYTNAQILSSVINHWAQPLITQMSTMIAADKLLSIPMLNNIENLVKHWGLVGPNYSIVNELPQLIAPLSSNVITPFLHKHLVTMEDAYIPEMAHNTVKSFIEQGGVTVFGRLRIETEDFKALQQLLDINLPCREESLPYAVKLPNHV